MSAPPHHVGPLQNTCPPDRLGPVAALPQHFDDFRNLSDTLHHRISNVPHPGIGGAECALKSEGRSQIVNKHNRGQRVGQNRVRLERDVGEHLSKVRIAGPVGLGQHRYRWQLGLGVGHHRQRGHAYRQSRDQKPRGTPLLCCRKCLLRLKAEATNFPGAIK